MKTLVINAALRRAVKADLFTDAERLIKNNFVFLQDKGKFVGTEILRGNESLKHNIIPAFHEAAFHMLTGVDDSAATFFFKLRISEASVYDLFDASGYGNAIENIIYYYYRDPNTMLGPFKIKAGDDENWLRSETNQKKIYIINPIQSFLPSDQALKAAS